MCRKVQFCGCQSKANAVQSQYVFWIVCWYPKKTTIAPRVSSYPSLHCSLDLPHCHWLGEGDRREINMFCQIWASFPHNIAKGWLSYSRIFLNTDISGLSIVQLREVNSLLHLERGSETKNTIAHYFSSAQVNFHWNREKKSREKHYIRKWGGKEICLGLYTFHLWFCVTYRVLILFSLSSTAIVRMSPTLKKLPSLFSWTVE